MKFNNVKSLISIRLSRRNLRRPLRSSSRPVEEPENRNPWHILIRRRSLLIGVLLILTPSAPLVALTTQTCQLHVSLTTIETADGPFENRFDGHAVLELDSDAVLQGCTFGSSPGTVVVTVPDHEARPQGFKMVHGNLPADAWSSDRIELNLYHNPALNDRLDAGEPDNARQPFNFHLFDTPIKIEVFQQNNTTATPDAATIYPFPDIPLDHWAGRYIVRLWKRGVVDGQGNSEAFGQFGLGLDVSRAEFVKLMMLARRSVDGPQSRVSGPLEGSYCNRATEVFDDVATHWSCDYVGLLVEAASELGWDPDYEGMRLFRPDLPLTRAGAARYAALLSTRAPGEPMYFSDLAGAPRSGSCAGTHEPPFADCVDEASAKRIVGGLTGTDTFLPDATLNRAEAAKIVAESFDILGPFQVRLDGRSDCGLCGKGKVVILIHGLNSGPEVWTWSGKADGGSMVAEFESLGFIPSNWHTTEDLRAAAAQMVSTGTLFTIRFSNSSDLTLAEQAEELGSFISAVVEAVNPAEVVLVGHSMGGLAARALAEFPLSNGNATDGTFHWKSGIYRSVVSRLVTLNTPHEGSPWPAILEAFPWGEILNPGLFRNSCFPDPIGDDPCTDLCVARSWIESKIEEALTHKAVHLLASGKLLEEDSELSKLRSASADNSTLSRLDPFYVTTWQIFSPESMNEVLAETLGFWAEWYDRLGGIRDSCWNTRIFPAIEPRMGCSSHDLVVCVTSQADDGTALVYDRTLAPAINEWHGSTRNPLVIEQVLGAVGPQGD